MCHLFDTFHLYRIAVVSTPTFDFESKNIES